MTLDVLISTLGHDGIQRVANMDLPHVNNVNYIVSWQLPDCNDTGQLPDKLDMRNDVKVFQLNSRGTSINRNNAIEHSTADICLIADDDLKYTAEQLQAVIDTFKNNPDVQLATFQHSGGNNKCFPNKSFDLRKPIHGYYVTAVEIAFLRQCCNGSLRFNELFGPGMHPLQAGEEGIFLHQAIMKGANCRFFPITITHHEGQSTGTRTLGCPGVLMASGAYIEIVYGLQGLLRLPLFAWRGWRRGQMQLFSAMLHLFKGYIYGKRHFNHDGSIKSHVIQ